MTLSDFSQTGAVGLLVSLAVFLSRRLVKLDGASIRFVDENCVIELAKLRSEFDVYRELRNTQISQLHEEISVLRVEIATLRRDTT